MSYVDFGNYKYGVVAAAAGYISDEALLGASAVNARNIRNPNVNTSGQYYSNPNNNVEILAGYNAFQGGTLCQ